MRGPIRSTETRANAFYSLWSTFALGHTETQIIEDERRSQIAQTSAMLPWVIIAYLLTLCTAVGATVESGRKDLLPILTMPSFCAAGLGLIGLILAHARLTGELTGLAPILLLDEIAAHLDEGRRAALFRIIDDLGGQAFMTGTDRSLFSSLDDRAQFFNVSGGSLTPA